MIEFMKAPALTQQEFATLTGFSLDVVRQIITPEPGTVSGGAGGWCDRGIVERIDVGLGGGLNWGYRFSTRGWTYATDLFGPTYIAAFRAAWPLGPGS